MTDTPDFFPLGAGLYRPREDNDVVFLHLGELCQAKGLPDTQELRLALFQAYTSAYAEEGITVILIAEDGVKSIEDFITGSLSERSETDEQA